MGWQILLVERLDIGHANPTHRVTFGRLWRGFQVQTDPVFYNPTSYHFLIELGTTLARGYHPDTLW